MTMGILFGEPDYVPNAKEKWQQRQRETAEERRRWEREQAAAKRIRDEQQREVDREADRAQKEMEALIRDQKREMRAAEKDMLTKPYHRTEGGSKALGDTPLILWHWQVPLPPEHNTAVNGQKRSDAGPLLALWDGGGIGDDDVIPVQLVESIGRTPALDDWAKRAGEVLEEVEKRYPIVADLRDDAALERLLRPVGVLRTFSETLPERGVIPAEDGSPITYERPVTVTELPTVSGVEVLPDGLRITFAYRAGETAKRWSSHLDALRVAFNANGVHNASNLRIKDGVNGELILDFDDAPSSFPAAVAPVAPTTTPQSIAEAIAHYEATRWMLGLDARGNVVSFPLKAQPHVLVTGGTGGGKSVWARGLIESLRTGYRDTDANSGKGQDCGGGWLAFVGDGKGSDFSALEGQPGIAMVAPSSDVAQIAVMVRRVRQEVERRFAQASAAKKRGEANAFAGMQPWLLLLDEWGAVAIKMRSEYGKSAEAFEKDIDIILRLGRECRVHCVLLSQTIRKTGDGAVPGSWQENLGLTVSLGTPSEITLQSDAFPAEVRDRAAFLGPRLKGKRGRGLTADRESGRVVEFQSFYGWSPGTTSLDPSAPKDVQPPTPEVKASWERWKEVCDTVPWLAPRFGIKALSSDWRGGDKADLNVIANTPVIPVTDANGVVPARLRQFDPASPEWLGAESLDAGGHVLEVGFVDEDGDGVDDHVQPTTVKAERDAKPAQPSKGQDGLRIPTPDEVAAMTAEERDAWMREYARLSGHLTDDTSETEPVGTEEPVSAEPESEGLDATPEPSAPKQSTTTPTTQGDDF